MKSTDFSCLALEISGYELCFQQRYPTKAAFSTTSVYIYIFFLTFWPCYTACETLIPQPEIKSALEAQHRTTRARVQSNIYILMVYDSQLTLRGPGPFRTDLWLPRRREGGRGMDWGLVCKLHRMGKQQRSCWTAQKSYIHYPATNHREKDILKEYICITGSLCCTTEINTVNQLYTVQKTRKVAGALSSESEIHTYSQKETIKPSSVL